MGKKIILQPEEREAILKDKKAMSYGELQKKYGYGASYLKTFCAEKGIRKQASDLKPQEFKGDYFNWDFEAF
jgi:hypothetical protein